MSKTIRFTDPDYFAFPKLRWTACHFRELMPTTVVTRGTGAARVLERAIDEGLDYSEDYSDPDADVRVYAEAGSPLPEPEGYDGPNSYVDFLQTVQPLPGTEHGKAFGYKTVNADALGWLVARTIDLSVAGALVERVWAPIGAEREAFYTVDSIGTPFAGGGFDAVLRDMARLGQLMLDEGVADGRQVIPAAAIERIRDGGDRDAFALSDHPGLPGWSYRGMWRNTEDDHAVHAARGVHGQTVYIDPAAGMVIARFASHPVAANAADDATSLPAYRAVAEHLMAQGERSDDGSNGAAHEASSNATDPAARADQTGQPGLLDGEWTVEDIANRGIIDTAVASLNFTTDGRLSGSGTCNRLLGSWSRDADGSPSQGSASCCTVCPRARWPRAMPRRSVTVGPGDTPDSRRRT